MRNSDNTIGNGSRELPEWSAVPQPNAKPRAHKVEKYIIPKYEERWFPISDVGQYQERKKENLPIKKVVSLLSFGYHGESFNSDSLFGFVYCKPTHRDNPLIL
jgi:hypothetical protein